jgi:hypothetical protein
MPLTPGRIYPNTTNRIEGFLTDEDGEPIDPSISVVFKLRSPDGEFSEFTYGTDPEVQRSEEGIYTADVKPTSPGRWFYQWIVMDGDAGELHDEGNILVQDTFFYEGGGQFYR